MDDSNPYVRPDNTVDSSSPIPKISSSTVDKTVAGLKRKEEAEIRGLSLDEAIAYREKKGGLVNPLIHQRIRALKSKKERASEKPSNNPDDWPDPEPLRGDWREPDPYPVEALPTRVKDAVLEYQSFGQQPISLVAQAALGAASAACQGIANVRRDDRLVGPISLSMMAVAESGERKSSCDTVFADPIRNVVDGWTAEALQEDEIVRERIETWDAQKQHLHREAAKLKVRAVTKSGNEKVATLHELDLVTAAIEEHRDQKPTPVRIPGFFYSDITPQGLGRQLFEHDYVGALWESEAGVTLGSVGMGNEKFVMQLVGSLNKLWDGGSLDAIRSDSTRNMRISGRRVTVNLMVQPLVLESYLAQFGRTARGSGFLSRFLLSAPQSTMGSRLYRVPVKNLPAVESYGRRLKKLLSTELCLTESGSGLDLPAIDFSDEAKDLWIDDFNETEQGIGADGPYQEVRDAAAKAGDNAARLAALFHLIDEHSVTDKIQPEAMRGAIQLTRWHLHEFGRALAATAPPEIADAEKLLYWLIRRGEVELTPRDIQHRGPYGTREKARRDSALRVLQNHGYVKIQTKRSGQRKIFLNPKAISL